jgi:hypothetical protein
MNRTTRRTASPRRRRSARKGPHRRSVCRGPGWVVRLPVLPPDRGVERHPDARSGLHLRLARRLAPAIPPPSRARLSASAPGARSRGGSLLSCAEGATEQAGRLRQTAEAPALHHLRCLAVRVRPGVRAGRQDPREACPVPLRARRRRRVLARPGWFECNSWDGGCRGAWDHKPEPGEHPQATFDDLYPSEDRTRLPSTPCRPSK